MITVTNNRTIEKDEFIDPIGRLSPFRYFKAILRITELPLYPAGAIIGREIRVVGNDAGEQLSILSGTLARLDREAPEYGYGKYNDFNTFYFQAASGTSGGSSGSPVIDIEGRVVALNAGGATGPASSFYLPLPAVTRALKYIDAGKPVPRGTLETVFKYTPYDELRRLGLEAATEARMRSAYPKLTGMLVADEVQPGSAADGVLSPGDILVTIDGKPVPEFFALEDVLDNHVGQQINVEVQRGNETLHHALEVQSLSTITADEYIEFGEAVVHTLSYQQARHYNLPIKGVYVANPGYVFGSAGIPRGALISSFNGKKTETLADFEAALTDLADGARAPVRYVTLEDPRAAQLKVIRMDRRWFPARKCKRDDALGIWPCVGIAAGPVAASLEPATTQYAKTGDPRIDQLAASLVMVTFDMPYSVSGVTEKNYHGTGVIVDTKRGLVVIDRNTVPLSMGDVRVTFTGVPAQTVSVAAGQASGALTAFRDANGYTIALAEPGVVSAVVLFHDEKKSEGILTWILRGVGFVVMLIGLVCMTQPLTMLFAVVPFLESLVGAGAFLVALTLAIPVTLLTIALAWIVHRPLIGAALLIGAVAAWYVLRQLLPRRIQPAHA